MNSRTLSLALAALLLAAPAFAQSLTDLLLAHRLTVLKVNTSAGQISCLDANGRLRVVELGNGALPLVVADGVQRADLNLLTSGDVIKVERDGGRASKVTVLRRASDEIASPER